MTKIVIATRGSMLALWQADYVTGLLTARGHECEKLVVKTTADRVQDRFLHEMGGKGLFVRELEEALADGRAQIAVHSLKDMTANLEPRFVLGAVLLRHAPTDVMIFQSAVAKRLGVEALPQELTAAAVGQFGALKIGTGSLRRQAILKKAMPLATTVGIRGNVDTRLRKLEAGEWDAIILAEASLDRLGIRNVPYRRLAADWFIPCASQGALAIECLAEGPARDWLSPLASAETTRAIEVERGLLARLGGDCNLPFGCLVARDAKDRETMVGRAAVWNPKGEKAEFVVKMSVASFAPQAMLDQLAAGLKHNGVARILADLGLTVPAAFA